MAPRPSAGGGRRTRGGWPAAVPARRLRPSSGGRVEHFFLLFRAAAARSRPGAAGEGGLARRRPSDQGRGYRRVTWRTVGFQKTRGAVLISLIPAARGPSKTPGATARRRSQVHAQGPISRRHCEGCSGRRANCDAPKPKDEVSSWRRRFQAVRSRACDGEPGDVGAKQGAPPGGDGPPRFPRAEGARRISPCTCSERPDKKVRSRVTATGARRPEGAAPDPPKARARAQK